jgi:DNA (cytosine-5)-methyltransferase 1
MKKIKFIDLFAGIGGFHLAFNNVGGKCVWVSEWDKYARQTYEANFKSKEPRLFSGDRFAGDITKVDPTTIPDFDVLTGGFPCQPFSQAGKKKGFEETRGTLFFDIAKILDEKRPRAFFLENVRGLLKHNNGDTLNTIKKVIEDELGYSFYYKVIKASDYGLPTHRPRLYMVGFRDKTIPFEFPKAVPLTMTMSDVLGGKANKDIGFTLRVGGRASGMNDRRNWDTYLVDGVVHRLNVKESAKLMGFPDDFVFPVSETQAMKQLGNSVAVPAIQATAKEIVKALRRYDV